MLEGLKKILETFGMDGDCLDNTGVAVHSVDYISAGPVNEATLEIVLEDKDGNKRAFSLMEIEAEY